MFQSERPKKLAQRRKFVLRAWALLMIVVAYPFFPVESIAQPPSGKTVSGEHSLKKVDQVFEVTNNMVSGLPVEADFVLHNNTGTTFRQLKVTKSCGCVSLRLPELDFESEGTLPMTLSYRPKGEDFSQVIEISGVAEGGDTVTRTRFARIHIVGKCEPPFVLDPIRFIVDPSVAGEHKVNLRGREGIVLESVVFQPSDSEVSCIRESDDGLRVQWSAMPSTSSFSVDVLFKFRVQDISNGVFEERLQFSKTIPISAAPSIVRMRVRDQALTGIIVITDQDSNGKGYDARFIQGGEEGLVERPEISVTTKTLSPGKYLCLFVIKDYGSVSEGFEKKKLLLNRVGESEAIVDLAVSFKPK